MKNYLILFLGILAFNFLGATPVNTQEQHPNFTIEQSTDFEQIDIVNTNTVSEVPLMFLEQYKEPIDTALFIVSKEKEQTTFPKLETNNSSNISETTEPIRLNSSDSIRSNIKPITSKYTTKPYLKHLEIHQNSSLFVSNSSYIDYLLFLKPFENGWSKSYIRKA